MSQGMRVVAGETRAAQAGAGSFLRALLAVVWKDLAAELRSRELISAMLVFSLLVILIFNFALELDPKTRAAVTSGVLYSTNLFQPGLILVILLGSIGYTAVGTLLAAMAVQTRTRDILLPILLFPVVIPVLLAAVKASEGFLIGADFAEILLPLNLLIAYDIIFIALAFMVFDNVVEE